MTSVLGAASGFGPLADLARSTAYIRSAHQSGHPRTRLP